jgi:aspartate-semialdehyde dehydrogenase
MSGLKIGVIGATGMVGRQYLEILEQSPLEIAQLRLYASARSVGSRMTFAGESLPVEEFTVEACRGLDIALFTVSTELAREFAPQVAANGTLVIDDSSAFRMDPDVPLVVPEVNPEQIHKHNGLIANPNCSTIIMNVPVWPLHKVNRVKRIIVSTYQAVSGAGAWGLYELDAQLKAYASGQEIKKEKFPHVIANNLFCHNTKVADNGYNEEENKMVNETRKIFGDPKIMVTATCVRVPIPRAHSESINLEFERPITPEQVREILSKAPGVTIVDDRANNHFPMPLEASGQDNVLVGRIRQDISRDDGRGIELFVSGDQIRKGAATNAVQIAEKLV